MSESNRWFRWTVIVTGGVFVAVFVTLLIAKLSENHFGSPRSQVEVAASDGASDSSTPLFGNDQGLVDDPISQPEPEEYSVSEDGIRGRLIQPETRVREPVQEPVYRGSSSRNGLVVCIDPGHPSENGVGARGVELTEVQVVWDIGVMLREELDRRGYEVVLTKSEVNEKVTNIRRAEIANESAAALVLRLHCDAASDTGFATFYPNTQGTRDGVTGPSQEVLDQIRPLAPRFHDAVIATLGGTLRDRGLRTERQTRIGGQYGALTGSIHSKVPVILVEMIVITQRSDEDFMKNESNRNLMVQALANGIDAALRQ